MDEVRLFGKVIEARIAYEEYKGSHECYKSGHEGWAFYVTDRTGKKIWFLGIQPYFQWRKGRTYLLDNEVYHSGRRVEGMM